MNIRINPYLLLVIATLCWAGNFVLGRAMHNDIPPIAMNFWRWTIAVAILLPFVMKAVFKYKKIIFDNIWILISLSITGIAAYHCFVYVALHSTTTINAILMNSMIPFIVPIFSYFIDKSTVSIRQLLGIALSLIGVIFIVTQGSIETLTNLQFAFGDILMIFAAMLWSLYTVLLKRYPKELPPLVFLFIISSIGILLLAPFYAYELTTVGGFKLTINNILAISYIAIFAAVVAFICWNKAVPQVGANKAGLFIHLMPLFSSILAIIFLGEDFELFHLIGSLFILTGIVITVLKSSNNPEAVTNS